MAISPITQWDSFSYITGWQFYMFHAVRPIHRYRLIRRLCGSNWQFGVLEKRFDKFCLQN